MIKIIDILNKIANDEEVPKKIQYKGTTWEYIEEEKDYSSKEWNEWLFEERIITDILNDYVEILEITIHNLETKKNNMIEKLNTEYILKRDYFDKEQSIKWLNVDIKDIVDKINEIIDRLNKE